MSKKQPTVKTKKVGLQNKEDQRIAARASNFSSEGYKHGVLGEYAIALEKLKKSEALYFNMIGENQGLYNKYKEPLARVFLNIANALYGLNCFEDSANYKTKFISLSRDLINSGKKEWRIYLAATLFNQGKYFSMEGRFKEALDYHQESSKWYQELVDNRELDYRANLLEVIASIGSCFIRLNFFKEANDCCKKIIDFCENIEIHNNEYLANAFNTASYLMVLTGYPDKGLDFSNKAVNIFQKLIDNNKKAGYEPRLAHAFAHKGGALFELEILNEALNFSEKSLEIYERISNHKNSYKEEQAHVLNNLGVICNNLNLQDKALNYCEKSVSIYREFVKNNKNRYLLPLATALVNLSTVRKLEYGPERAFGDLQEAIEIYQELIKDGRTELNIDLARALYNKGAVYKRLEHYGDAYLAYQQAANLCRKLIDNGQAHYQPMLSITLVGLLEVQLEIKYVQNIINDLVDEIISTWKVNEDNLAILKYIPWLAQIICRIKQPDQFMNFVKELAKRLNITLSKVYPQNLNYFYPLAEKTFTELLLAAIDRKLWDLALTLVGTARAQRLAKLAQTDLLNRAARMDDPAELAEYRRIYTRFAELEILLNTKLDAADSEFGTGRLLDADGDRRHAVLHAEYADLRHRLDELEQKLQGLGLLPKVENTLFDGAAILARLPPDEAIALLFSEPRVGVDGHEKSALGILLLTREHGQILALGGFMDLTERLERITVTLKTCERGLREGPLGAADSPSPVQESAASIAVDEQAEALVQALVKTVWKPIDSTLSEMTAADKTGRWHKLLQRWKPTTKKSTDRRITTVWLIPTGLAHGLPWQASAPPGLRCRIVPAPWFLQQALERTEPLSLAAAPTAENPLGVLAYDAPNAVERKHKTPSKELLHVALEQRFIEAVWGEAAHPLSSLADSSPPCAFAALAGHGDSDANIPGAARVWVGRAANGERRHVDFSELWRTPLDLQSVYLSSCVVGMTHEVNGEPLGLFSAGMLRGARYLIGWPVRVDDLGVALFSLLYHWAWRECRDPARALESARQAFLSGDWPEGALTIARQHLEAHIQGILKRYMDAPTWPATEKNSLRHSLNHLINAAISAIEHDPIKLFWGAVTNRDEKEMTNQTKHVADRLLDCRDRLSCRYISWFALGCG